MLHDVVGVVLLLVFGNLFPEPAVFCRSGIGDAIAVQFGRVLIAAYLWRDVYLRSCAGFRLCFSCSLSESRVRLAGPLKQCA